MDTPSPKIAAGHPGRPLECQLVLRPAFQDFVRRVQASGWTEDEVADAMLDLAHNHLIGIIEGPRRQRYIDKAQEA